MKQESKTTRFTGADGNIKIGSWFFRINGYGLMLKAPWNASLFSERYGYRKFLKFFGWRIGCLTP